MQIFEYYFNPKNEEGKTFKSFIYEPKNSTEKKLGSLYLLGETKTDNSNILERLSKYIKEKFYKSNLITPEKSLPETLKKANDFLAEEVKKENVSWLGNLNFGIFSLKDLNLNFTKTGNFKILLIRSNNITDIGKNVEKEELDPYPLKVFFNVISGKLAPSDVLLIISPDIYDFLKEKEVINKIVNLEEYNEKKIKEIFSDKLFNGKEGLKASGLCFIAVLDDTISIPKEFSFQEKIKNINIPNIPKKINIKKNHLTIFFFLIILLIGFILFQKSDNRIEENKKEEEFIEKIESIYNDQNIENLEDPNEFFNLIENEDQIIYFNKDVYSFKYPNNLYKIDSINKDKEKINLLGNFTSLVNGQNSIFLISKEGKIFQVNGEKNIDIESGFELIESYGSNLYLLNKENCNIEKYSLLNETSQNWFKEKKENQTCLSFAVDGSIWVLNKENSIDLYHEGIHKKTINIEKNTSKIKTSFNDPYIYLLYPLFKRVVIIDKDGNLIKQIYSDSFNDLKDIFIIKEENNILILNGDKIYKVNY